MESDKRGKSLAEAVAQTSDFFDQLKAHYRKAKRKDVAIKCEVKLMVGSETFDRGVGVIQDMSPSGALIVDIKTEKNVFPISAFSVYVKLLEGECEGIYFDSTPVRIIGESSGIGVSFTEFGIKDTDNE